MCGGGGLRGRPCAVCAIPALRGAGPVINHTGRGAGETQAGFRGRQAECHHHFVMGTVMIMAVADKC